MKKASKLLIPFSLMLAALSGCVVAPVGYYHRGYYGPRVAVVARRRWSWCGPTGRR